VTDDARVSVLFVINGLGTGGAERSLAEMLPRLQVNDIDVSVACLFHRDQGVEDMVRSSGVDVQVLRGRHLPGRIVALHRLIRSRAPAVVHTTIFQSDVAGRVAAATSGAALISSLVNTPYDAIRLRDPNVRRLGLRATRWIDGWTARNLTTHFHAISDTVKRATVEALGIPPSRITVIPRGRDPQRLGMPSLGRRLETRRSLGWAPDDEVVVTIGRQEFQKGQRYLLDAMASVRSSRPHLRLIIAGRNGNASPELEQMVHALELGDRVHFMGHREDVPNLLAAADLFAFPSLYEGFGGSLVEAMALGLPIVASDVPAIREVVDAGRNALLVHRADPEALARGIVNLLDHPEKRDAFGRWSRQRFEERFTIDRVVPRMAELYRWLAAARRPSEVAA
jgi:glycosyltransferase involved in cell wall biosynthesis